MESKKENPSLKLSFRQNDDYATKGIYKVNCISTFYRLYDLGDKIGHGTYSTVYICRHKSTGSQFAVKMIHKHMCKRHSNLREEIKVLLKVKHKNIICLTDIFENEDELYLLMERATGGELFTRIVNLGAYTESQSADIAYHLLEGLVYLHNNNIIHRDIKPENILLMTPDSTSSIKICDFGIAKIMENCDKEKNSLLNKTLDMRSSRIRTYTSCGSSYYIAPEILAGKGYDEKVDLWSVGVVLYVMLCGFPPFTQESSSNYEIKSEVEFPSDYWCDITSQAKHLISKLLNIDPLQRYNAQEALNHPWIKERNKLPG